MPASEQPDRRSSSRAHTQRRALVRLRTEGLPAVEALVLDVAPLGMRLSTRLELRAGDLVEVEVFSQDPMEAPMLVRGQVRHAEQDAWDQVGISLTVALGETRDVAAPDRETYEQLRAALFNLPAKGVEALTFNVVGEDMPPVQTSEPKPRRWGWGWLLILLFLLLLLLAGALVLLVIWEPSRVRTNRDVTSRTPPVIYETTWQDRAAAALRMPERVVLTQVLDAAPVAGDPIDAWLALELAEMLDIPSGENLSGGFLEGIPMPALGFETAAAGGQLEQLGSLRLEIDTGDYTLRVWRDAALLGAFPVGLGAPGATPHGVFEIANKIAEPDWYNRGDVVPAGDPRNPLGAHWLGLTSNGGPEGIGIHPTDDQDSIGGNLSKGCIRMFPADAAQVFAWCEVGTPVEIHP